MNSLPWCHYFCVWEILGGFDGGFKNVFAWRSSHRCHPQKLVNVPSRLWAKWNHVILSTSRVLQESNPKSHTVVTLLHNILEARLGQSTAHFNCQIWLENLSLDWHVIPITFVQRPQNDSSPTGHLVKFYGKRNLNYHMTKDVISTLIAHKASRGLRFFDALCTERKSFHSHPQSNPATSHHTYHMPPILILQPS